MLQSMGSQKVGHDWVTEMNWTELIATNLSLLYLPSKLLTSQVGEVVFNVHLSATLSNFWHPDCESESCSVVSDSFQPHELYSPWNSPGQNSGDGNLSLLQGIFPTQGLNPGLLHCRWILYQLSHNGSPRILEWGAYPFSRDLPDPGIEPGSPHCRWILYQLSYQRSNKFKGPNKTVDKGWSTSLRSTTPLLIFRSGT